jgi:hypothetical protein
MDERLIQVQAATRIACLRMTTTYLKALHDIVDHASWLPARSEWGARTRSLARHTHYGRLSRWARSLAHADP